MRFDRKRVQVNGGAGFLGSHLCEHLLLEEESVLSGVIQPPLARQVAHPYGTDGCLRPANPFQCA